MGFCDLDPDGLSIGGTTAVSAESLVVTAVCEQKTDAPVENISCWFMRLPSFHLSCAGDTAPVPAQPLNGREVAHERIS